MRAVVFRGKDIPWGVADFPKPKAIKDQVLVKLHRAAVNHHDLWVTLEQEAVQNKDGIILGSDGCGIIEDVGPDADPALIGMEVIINPGLDWGDSPIVQGNAFNILGDVSNGTFAEYIAISKKYVFERPEHLTLDESAALPLAGLTAYRALFTKGRLRAKEKVLITGIGGGAALWALQLAIGYDARVSVTSSSEEKLARAKQLGAIHLYNYKDTSWVERAQRESGGFDVIIDSAGGEDFNNLVELCAPGGRIVNFGRTSGSEASFNVRKLFWKQLSVFGTTMGTRDEFLSLLEFIEGRKIKPVIDQAYPLEKIKDAFARMEQGSQFGKIVLKIN